MEHATQLNAPAEGPAAVESNPGMVLAGGLITLAATMSAFGAIDDITTDNSTSFTLEYIVLTVCGAWCFFVSSRFLTKGRRFIGAISMVLLLSAIWGQRAIGPGTVASFQPEYVATVASLLWFFVLSIAMTVAGFRRLV